MEAPASAIWMHGTTGTGVQVPVNLGLANQISVAKGDKLNWYQYQQSSGGTDGGMNLTFENGWQLNGSCTTCSGQPGAAVDQNGVPVDRWGGNAAWTWRIADLSSFAGHTVTGAQLIKSAIAPGGDWDLLFSFISVSHANGQVDTIYDA